MTLEIKLISEIKRLGGVINQTGLNTSMVKIQENFKHIFLVQWPQSQVYKYKNEDEGFPFNSFNPCELDFNNANGKDLWGINEIKSINLIPYLYTCHGQLCFIKEDDNPSDPLVLWADQEDRLASVLDWHKAKIRLSALLEKMEIDT